MTFLQKMLLPALLSSAIFCNAQKLSPPGFDSPAQNSTIDIPFTIKGLSFTRIVNAVWHANSSQVKATIESVFRDEDGIDRVQEKKTITVPVDANGNWVISNISLQAPPANATNRRLSVVAWQVWNGQSSEKMLLLCNFKDLKIFKAPPQMKKIIKKPIYVAPPRDMRRGY